MDAERDDATLLDELTALLAASTQGEWGLGWVNFGAFRAKVFCEGDEPVQAESREDGELIVAMHNALPRLIELARIGVATNDKLYAVQVEMAKRDIDWKTKLNNEIYNLKLEMARRDADWQAKFAATERGRDAEGDGDAISHD